MLIPVKYAELSRARFSQLTTRITPRRASEPRSTLYITYSRGVAQRTLVFSFLRSGRGCAVGIRVATLGSNLPVLHYPRVFFSERGAWLCGGVPCGNTWLQSASAALPYVVSGLWSRGFWVLMVLPTRGACSPERFKNENAKRDPLTWSQVESERWGEIPGCNQFKPFLFQDQSFPSTCEKYHPPIPYTDCKIYNNRIFFSSNLAPAAELIPGHFLNILSSFSPGFFPRYN